MKVAFYALGCKVNQYEADCYSTLFKEAGWETGNFDEVCDVYVINTCAITNIGERKSRQILRRAKKKNPDALVVATGCYAQTKAEELMKMDEIGLVLGTANRSQIVKLTEAKLNGQDVDALKDIMKERLYEELECEGETERTRAYVEIQDGCDNFCSYCIVPYARGPVRSRNLKNIQKEVKRLAGKGFREIVLTGISVNSYGKDLAEDISLTDVIKEVCAIDGVERVRLSSIAPGAFSDDFIDEIKKEEKLCRHFHISLQSGSTTVLKRMNRKYTAEEYLKTLEKIRNAMPDAHITTDIICGFPGETEDEAKETLDFVKKAKFLKVHVFPYSERSGTVAARMEQIDKSVREARARQLIKICDDIACDVEKSYIGKTVSVLFEKSECGSAEGLSKNYLRVFTECTDVQEGEIRQVKITKMKGKKLFGELI